MLRHRLILMDTIHKQHTMADLSPYLLQFKEISTTVCAFSLINLKSMTARGIVYSPKFSPSEIFVQS